jgi:signal peptidase II
MPVMNLPDKILQSLGRASTDDGAALVPRFVLRPKHWVLMIILVGLPILLDQMSKNWALSHLVRGLARKWGPLMLTLVHNSGAMGGMLSSWPPLIRTVSISTWALVLVFFYFVFQFLIATRAPILRCGLSLYLGAILSNAYDRVARGAVVDFVTVPALGLSHWVFNVSDFVQWLAIGMILWALFREWLRRRGNLRRLRDS